MKLELVYHYCRVVIFLIDKIFLNKPFVEVIVYADCKFHLVHKVKEHFSADALDLSESNFLVLVRKLDLLLHNLIE